MVGGGSVLLSLESGEGAPISQRQNTTNIHTYNVQWRNKNEKIFILQTLLIVIKLFVLFNTYNQETGKENVVPDTEPFL